MAGKSSIDAGYGWKESSMNELFSIAMFGYPRAYPIRNLDYLPLTR